MSSWRSERSAMQTVADSCQLRPMRLGDLPQVMRVERAGYEFPWTEGIFRDCLRARYVCKVLEKGDLLAGHGIMSVMVGESHILNVCVHPDYQRRGFGRQILSHLLALARSDGARSALLEVRRSNHAAFSLYDQMGFNQIGVRKGYYPARRGTREDALVLAREL